jgi:hypothetical protein
MLELELEWSGSSWIRNNFRPGPKFGDGTLNKEKGADFVIGGFSRKNQTDAWKTAI